MGGQGERRGEVDSGCLCAFSLPMFVCVLEREADRQRERVVVVCVQHGESGR